MLRLAHGRLTLDELVSGAWAAIGAGFPAACPVCDGPMSPNGSVLPPLHAGTAAPSCPSAVIHPIGLALQPILKGPE